MKQQQLPKYAYIRGEIVPYAQAQVGVMTHALNYGTGVFGGIRGYWNADDEQLYIFRPLDHFQRIHHSAHIMRMKVEHSPEELTDILCQLLRKENYRENVYVRPLVYKSTEMIGVRLHDIDDDITIFALPFGQYVANEKGLHVCFSAWQRVSDNTMPARGKVTGAYANSALIKSDAILSGYDEAFVLTSDGHLSEGSAANVMMVRHGKLITPPISDDILEGITRKTVLELAQAELGIEVVERKIDRTEIYLADELLMCGTGMQIAAVTQVEHRTVGNGEMGEITRQLRDLYFDATAGRIEKYRHWLTPVYVEETTTA
ncbi:MAG: branched-chain amino acid transaminase [Chloroflexota bacterium]